MYTRAARKGKHGGFSAPLASGDGTTYGVRDVQPENGSRQGLNLASTGLFVPGSLDSGMSRRGPFVGLQGTRLLKSVPCCLLSGRRGREGCALHVQGYLAHKQTPTPLGPP